MTGVFRLLVHVFKKIKTNSFCVFSLWLVLCRRQLIPNAPCKSESTLCTLADVDVLAVEGLVAVAVVMVVIVTGGIAGRHVRGAGGRRNVASYWLGCGWYAGRNAKSWVQRARDISRDLEKFRNIPHQVGPVFRE